MWFDFNVQILDDSAGTYLIIICYHSFALKQCESFEI